MNYNKYRAIKTEYGGNKFHSKKEANYCKTLELLKNAKGTQKVLKYELQPRFDIVVNNVKIAFYKADFKVFYSDRIEIIDVKGIKTPVYKLKKRLVEAIFKISIIEK